MKQAVVTRDSDIMGGAPVFAGTRVPVQTLLDYLEAGDTIDDFLKGFPGVTRKQVIVLEPENEGGFTVRVPVLPEIVTYGKDEREALAMAEDAIRLVIADSTAAR